MKFNISSLSPTSLLKSSTLAFKSASTPSNSSIFPFRYAISSLHSSIWSSSRFSSCCHECRWLAKISTTLALAFESSFRRESSSPSCSSARMSFEARALFLAWRLEISAIELLGRDPRKNAKLRPRLLWWICVYFRFLGEAFWPFLEASIANYHGTV
ncbi:methylthioalkylmalate synthase 2 [Striga asiatica]|uniref:Methylthioalkylmalate synthase 2 n=1 Tax=Striga asiatica TaxID=4170 RepID=A0A5A7P1R9_STRAF|nr:methylthioalkylmalate synthase 2 [Striga asiatica]